MLAEAGASSVPEAVDDTSKETAIARLCRETAFDIMGLKIPSLSMYQKKNLLQKKRDIFLCFLLIIFVTMLANSVSTYKLSFYIVLSLKHSLLICRKTYFLVFQFSSQISFLLVLLLLFRKKMD